MINLFVRFVTIKYKPKQMKRITFLGFSMLFVLVMVGCQSSSKITGLGNSKSEYLKKIPHLANRIYVTKSGVSAD